LDLEISKNIIRDAYVQILKREPDKIGFDHFLNLFQNGKLNEDELIALMKNSEEFKPLELVENFIEKYDLLFRNKNKKQKLQELNKIGQYDKRNANFFWYGNNFGFLNNLVMKSHLKVGHNPKIWLMGSKPNNQYWKDIEDKITVVGLNDYLNVEEWLDFGGNLRMAASLWQLHFLYACGGLYCDADHFALKKFPDDKWIVCSGETNSNLFSTGFMQAPPNDELFLDAIKNYKSDWGILEIFTTAYKKKYGNTRSTHTPHLFYPYASYEWNTLFENVDIPNSFSIHFYQRALEDNLKEKFKLINENWCEKNPNTLLGRLYNWLNTTK